jgi:hypothetical protein
MLMYVFIFFFKKGLFYYETNKRVSPVECNFAHHNITQKKKRNVFFLLYIFQKVAPLNLVV